MLARKYVMWFCIEEFFENGFNFHLTGNDFDIVLFSKYHLGFNFRKQSSSLYIQNIKNTYFINLYYTDEEYKRCTDEEFVVYKKRLF